jgi:hypothetical protein
LLALAAAGISMGMRASPLTLLVAIPARGYCGEWQRVAQVPSPDGRTHAVVESKDLGACCSDHSRVSLVDGPGGSLIEPGVVVEAANADARATWANNDLLIVEVCRATRIEARSRSLRKRVTKPDGAEDAVRVEVVTVPDTRRGDLLHCSSSGSS